ncbi:MAG: hypothetical protein AVDCRST_MAG77-1120 [uncultured Chloroflexi bacterium]|uniref:Uncharacterized protein n=1 Tax=uncultured Chloroflexota bacterium TaxID=166587 RepID=A0A6J4HTA8_9CHLR|nr:MAG: hypothetical protein AVDCRST_MAG77-1120 [uncultured Chloroflexota bacterium]
MATAEKQKASGEEQLRRNGMMAHLMEALEKGTDIGHYGRLVFAMVAHHFMDEDTLVGWLQKDKDFDGPAGAFGETGVEPAVPAA